MKRIFDDVKLMVEKITTNCTKVSFETGDALFTSVGVDTLEPEAAYTDTFYTDDWYGIIQEKVAVIKSFDVNDKKKPIACFEFDFETCNWKFTVVGEEPVCGHCDCPNVTVFLDIQKGKTGARYLCEIGNTACFYEAQEELEKAMDCSCEYVAKTELKLLAQDDCSLEAFSGKLQVVDGVPYFPDLNTELTSRNELLTKHGWTVEVTDNEVVLKAVGADGNQHDKLYQTVFKLNLETEKWEIFYNDVRVNSGFSDLKGGIYLEFASAGENQIECDSKFNDDAEMIASLLGVEDEERIEAEKGIKKIEYSLNDSFNRGLATRRVVKVRKPAVYVTETKWGKASSSAYVSSSDICSLIEEIKRNVGRGTTFTKPELSKSSSKTDDVRSTTSNMNCF